MSVQRLKISIDLDGTLFAHRDFFCELMRLFQSAGHDVGRLTGHKAEAKEHDLAKLAADGFPAPSFYLGRPPDYMPFNGSIYKRDMIREHGIDIHFDDCDYGNKTSERLFEVDEQARLRLFRLPKDVEKAKEHGW